jgi:uracil-DNA glycosylase family 4
MLRCTRCHLHKTRVSQVPGRGFVPCDILVIDAAPGKAEDVTGRGFGGPAFRLFERAIGEAVSIARTHEPRVYYTYMVQCKPCDMRGGAWRAPSPAEVDFCSVNLLETFTKVQPKFVVYLSAEVRRLCEPRFSVRGVTVPHPEFILRRGGTECAEYRAMRATLEQLVEKLEQERNWRK